jgi:hypothetical protein
MVAGVPKALIIVPVLLIDIGTDIRYDVYPVAHGPCSATSELVKFAKWGVGIYRYCYNGVLQYFLFSCPCWLGG